jgi:hypothetical protein
MRAEEFNENAILAHLERITSISQGILGFEWRRVKTGT